MRWINPINIFLFVYVFGIFSMYYNVMKEKKDIPFLSGTSFKYLALSFLWPLLVGVAIVLKLVSYANNQRDG